MRPLTLEDRVLKRIARKRGDVFLRTDFRDLGGYDQVGRTLRELVSKGRLLRMGQGIYTRAAPSPFDGKPAPVRGITRLTTEALRRIGITARPSKLEQDYNAGKTTQVPSGRTIGVDRPVRRKLQFNGIPIRFERA